LVRPPGDEEGQPLLLAVGDDPTAIRDVPRDACGVLAIGRGGSAGLARGAGRAGPGGEPIDRLKIVGPGMEVARVGAAGGAGAGVEGEAAERWSGTVGALGVEAWMRLTGLAYGVVGVGRTGSAVAEAVANGWGAERLTLIDPDTIERHNLGEMAG